ncbi:hypothetical protein [Streptomyces bungoensis]|uniref:hypothetical protein n=1 Tax=Streptomyces bungoensis TaxID=285568 RepID=UPI003426C1B1
MCRYEQRIIAAALTTADHWREHACTGRTPDVGQEKRRFALDTTWHSLSFDLRHPGRLHKLKSTRACGWAENVVAFDTAYAEEL